MAISSQNTHLMVYNTTASAWEQVICIKEFGDLGGAPELLQTTTMCQVRNHTYIPGLQDTDSVDFTANYTREDYAHLLTLADGTEREWALFFSNDPDGVPNTDNGAFYWPGVMSVWKTGQGVNEVQDISFTISVAGDIIFDEDPFA